MQRQIVFPWQHVSNNSSNIDRYVNNVLKQTGDSSLLCDIPLYITDDNTYTIDISASIINTNFDLSNSFCIDLQGIN